METGGASWGSGRLSRGTARGLAALGGAGEGEGGEGGAIRTFFFAGDFAGARGALTTPGGGGAGGGGAGLSTTVSARVVIMSKTDMPLLPLTDPRIPRAATRWLKTISKRLLNRCCSMTLSKNS